MRRLLLAIISLVLSTSIVRAQVSLRLPFDNDQWWGPATYDGHFATGRGSCCKEYAIDFWRASNVRNQCQFWDQGSSGGQNVRAAHNAKVILAGGNGGYGNCVILEAADGTFRTLYGHMRDNSLKVSVGPGIISAGTVLGSVGMTGSVIGTNPEHLHFEYQTKVNNVWTAQSITNLAFDGQVVDFVNWQCVDGVPRYKGRAIHATACPEHMDNVFYEFSKGGCGDTVQNPLGSWTIAKDKVNTNGTIWFINGGAIGSTMDPGGKTITLRPTGGSVTLSR